MAKGEIEMTASDKKWEAENDMRTLAEAEEIRRDKKRHNAAKAMARKKIADMKKVAEDK